MRRLHLGEFEELVLLTVGILYKEAYAVAITKEIEKQSGRSVNVSAVHKSLYRLEEKGMLKSRLGEAESKRGGKRKRIFVITPVGKKALDESADLRVRLRNQISEFVFDWKVVSFS
jgi:DNA-binding PadR family transcriptional regulator